MSPYKLHWKCDKCCYVYGGFDRPGDGGLCPQCGNKSSIEHLIRVITARRIWCWWNPTTWFNEQWEEI